ncbi:MAG TPA: hypothetical protein VJS65_09130, partial [Verrucomicrobiae bacterium]|nr:hypothetical protein [Verrucomicrobiae bacterium]
MTVAKGKSEAEAKTPARDAAVDGSKGGALKNWLPLIVTVILMPVLAFATTNFLILPKIVHARGGEPGEAGAADGESIKKEGKGAHGTAGKKRLNYQVSKVIVNVAGSM